MIGVELTSHRTESLEFWGESLVRFLLEAKEDGVEFYQYDDMLTLERDGESYVFLEDE